MGRHETDGPPVKGGHRDVVGDVLGWGLLCESHLLVYDLFDGTKAGIEIGETEKYMIAWTQVGVLGGGAGGGYAALQILKDLAVLGGCMKGDPEGVGGAYFLVVVCFCFDGRLVESFADGALYGFVETFLPEI